MEYVEQIGEENCYISFSGGKDSTVLLHLVRSLYPNITAVFSDTGLEFPEIKNFVKSFEEGKEKSTPLGFWTEQDILEYIHKYNINICSVYGNIIEENNTYKTTGYSRTGCVFCAFGSHLEPSPNRFEQLKETHPKLHNYCINKLGMGEVLDFIGVKY